MEPTEEPVFVPVDCDVEIEIEDEKDVYYYGDKITFRATVNGCEGVNYQINWEFNDNEKEDEDEEEWEIAGTGETFTFVITEENVDWQWRAAVVIAE